MDAFLSFLNTLLGDLTTSTPVTQTGIEVPVLVEYMATIVSAIAGGLFACDRKYDIFGTMTIACAAGLGGGLIRDVLLQTHGIYMFQEPMIIIACIIAAIVVFYFSGLFKYLPSMFFLLDALSVGLFAFLGADKAIQAGLTFIPVVLLGMLTAVGGGLLRDVLCRETPQLFKQGNFYGFAGLGGSFIYSLLAMNSVLKGVAGLACVITVLLLRYLSVIFNWRTSEPKDHTQHLFRSVRQFVGQIFLRSGRSDDGDKVATQATDGSSTSTPNATRLKDMSASTSDAIKPQKRRNSSKRNSSAKNTIRRNGAKRHGSD